MVIVAAYQVVVHRNEQFACLKHLLDFGNSHAFRDLDYWRMKIGEEPKNFNHEDWIRNHWLGIACWLATPGKIHLDSKDVIADLEHLVAIQP